MEKKKATTKSQKSPTFSGQLIYGKKNYSLSYRPTIEVKRCSFEFPDVCVCVCVSVCVCVDQVEAHSINRANFTKDPFYTRETIWP